MAQYMLAGALAARGLRPGQDFEVSSAGVGDYAETQSAIEFGAWRELSARGIDASGHKSRPLTPEMLQDTDLVLTMEIAQARAAVVSHPDSLGRVFSLKEFAQLAVETAETMTVPSGSAGVSLLAQKRTNSSFTSRHLDVVDPMGGTSKDFAQCASQIADLVEVAADVLVGLPIVSPGAMPGVIDARDKPPVPPNRDSRGPNSNMLRQPDMVDVARPRGLAKWFRSRY